MPWYNEGWYKTFFTVRGDQDTLDKIRDLTQDHDQLDLKRLVVPPEELLSDSQLSPRENQLLDLILIMEEEQLPFKETKVKDLFEKNIIRDDPDNEIIQALKTAGEDSFLQYCQHHLLQESKSIIPYLKSKDRYGYVSLEQFYLNEYSSGCVPIGCASRDTDSIKGMFMTTWLPPIAFFLNLKNLFPVEIDVSYIDSAAGIYVTLDEDFQERSSVEITS
nr:MAG TPA: hypothetical protein [Caudoviricetes sp.]